MTKHKKEGAHMIVRIQKVCLAACHLAVAAFALLTLGMSSQAHAYSPGSYVVRLDNKTTDNYAKAKSDAVIRVCLSDLGQGSQCQERVLNSISGSHDFYFWDITPWHDVWVTMQPGPKDVDLLVIDQLELWHWFDGAWHVERTRGTDNTTGECFSSQSADFSNSHCCSGCTQLAGTAFDWVI